MDTAERSSLRLELVLLVASLAALAALGWDQEPQHYLLFHTLAEMFGITVAAGAFMVMWNARRFAENGYLQFIAITGLFISGLDLFHLLTYKGLSVLPYRTADVPTQLWVAARYMQALSFMLAPLFLKRRLRPTLLAAGAFALASALGAAIMLLHRFPEAFVEGQGLTPFKNYSEFVIIAIMLAGLTLLLRKRDSFAPSVLALIAGSIVVFALAEGAFTMYASVYGRANLVGHLLRIVAVYGIYRAIIATSLSRPYEVLFRDLKQSETRLRRNAALSEALNAIDADLRSSLDEETMLRTIGARAAEAMGVEAVNVAMREDGLWIETYAHGFPALRPGSSFTDAELPIHSEAWRGLRPVVVDDVTADRLGDSEAARANDLASYLVVPLIVKEQAIGALGFAKLRTPARFTEEQIDFATRLAASLSLALDNARLYAAEHRIADTLQEALISPPPDVIGLEFSHLYRSASEAARVGGDFYDVFEVRPGLVGIIVGDVSGKGIEAAALTAVVKTAVKVNVGIGGAPAEVMSRTNDFLHRHTSDSSFVTVFYGTLDLRSGALSYCSAGHPPAAIRRADGNAQLLRATSPLVGAFGDVGFCDEREVLGPGDTLMLYTDGVIECKGAAGQFGEERLLETVSSWDGEVSSLPAHLLEAVRDHCGDLLTDDVAVVALTRAA